MRLDDDLQRQICDDVALFGSMRHASQAVAISESSLYRFIATSREHKKAGSINSPHYFEWRGSSGFLIDQIRRAKNECVTALTFSVMQEARHGVTEELRDPSSQRRIPKLDPQWIGVSDEAMRDALCDPVRDRWLWQHNENGERTEPQWETRTVHMPASLRAKILAGLAPSVFGESSQVDVTHRGTIVSVMQPAPYIPRAQREQQQTIEGECKDVTRELLLQKAQEHLASPDRITSPSAPVVVHGRNTGDPPDRVTSVNSTAPRPQPASYIRRTAPEAPRVRYDPHKDPRAMKMA
jgi:hypothetical protein